MSLGKKLKIEEVRSLAFGSIGATYTAIGTASDSPIGILHVQNMTDALLMFSYDGVTDHFPLASSSFLLLDITTNQANDPVLSGLSAVKGTTLYVREIDTPTSGAVYATYYSGASR